MFVDLKRLKRADITARWLKICCNLTRSGPTRADILLIRLTEDSTTLRDQIRLHSSAWRPWRLKCPVRVGTRHGH